MDFVVLEADTGPPRDPDASVSVGDAPPPHGDAETGTLADVDATTQNAPDDATPCGSNRVDGGCDPVASDGAFVNEE